MKYGGHAAARIAGLGLFVLLSAFLAQPVMAQEDDWAPEAPLVRETGVSARALGMGGAYLAVSDDAAALHYNVAGLARVQRVEFSTSLIDVQREMQTEMQGDRISADIAHTRLSALGFAYPFPVYRGSLVFGAGYFAPYVLDRDYARYASWNNAGEQLGETLHEEGAAGEWSVGLATDVSPTLSFGARASWIHGDRFQDWLFERVSGPDFFALREVIDIELTGVTASLGALARLSDWGRLGLILDLPRWVDLSGTLTILDDPDDPLDVTIEEELTLPLSVGIGLSAMYEGLLLAADARFTDWTQIDYAGPLRIGSGLNREFAYRRTADLHLGLEYLLDVWPEAGIRLRAGYAREPVPYRVVLEDISPALDPVYREADFDPDRSTFTLGAGVLLQESLTLDAAYTHSNFTRSGGSLSEEESEDQILISAAFRLR